MDRVERWCAGFVLAVLARRVVLLLAADYSAEAAFLWRQVPVWADAARKSSH